MAGKKEENTKYSPFVSYSPKIQLKVLPGRAERNLKPLNKIIWESHNQFLVKSNILEEIVTEYY